MWILLHVNGCNKPCFKRLTKPLNTDPVLAEPCRNLDNTQVLSTDPIICQSCGSGLSLFDICSENWMVLLRRNIR